MSVRMSGRPLAKWSFSQHVSSDEGGNSLFSEIPEVQIGSPWPRCEKFM
jgi:hypothetical protein